MPSTMDWINEPLGVVEGMFAASQNHQTSGWEAKVVEFFKEQLKEKEAQSSVPSLNDVPLHYLKPDSLVKFRCLIQDMFDPEFYMGVYETVDPSTSAKTLRCGRYKDVAECSVDFSSRTMTTAERQTFYCVPVPGENSWVKEMYAGSSQARVVPSTSYVPSRQKRSFEEDEDMDVQPQKQKEGHAASQSPVEQHGHGDCTRLETSASHLDLNFPLPGEKGPSCLVKVYEDWDNFKLNDVLEVYGILSVSPALSALADQKDALLDPSECMETAEEQRVHSPPASLVPRLHMVYAKPLLHNNPLLPCTPPQDTSTCRAPCLYSGTNVPPGRDPGTDHNPLQDQASLLQEGEVRVPPGPGASPASVFSSTPSEAAAVREELLSYFTRVLLGDALAAEFLLLQLISSVYARRDVLPLGKFTVNLSGCPAVASYTERLYQLLQQLVPSSVYLAMSLQNMNHMRLTPKKDYVANRLVSGALQLDKNTTLFLDETRLQQGQLDATGVRNVTALGNVISWQKVDYDFSYHHMEFPCNINVLVVSEGRSLLPSDCHVHLQPQVAPFTVEEYVSAIQGPQASLQLNKFRMYLSAARLLDYSIPDEVTKSVEDDFVDMRKDDPQGVSAEDLHRMLVVARLLSLSLGQTSLSRDVWARAKHMETLRRSRLEQRRSVNGNEP